MIINQEEINEELIKRKNKKKEKKISYTNVIYLMNMNILKKLN